MRISDWSSDVCSSDLIHGAVRRAPRSRGERFRQTEANAPGSSLRRKVCPSAPHRRAASLLVRRSLRSALQWRKSYASCLTIASIRHRPTVSDPDSGDRRHIAQRSEEHTSELQSLMRISYAVFCLKKKNKNL